MLVELQLDVDPVKQRKWPLAAALLLDWRGLMGDIVVTLTGHAVEPLLDEAHPELAFFAAFAMHERHDLIARRASEPPNILPRPSSSRPLAGVPHDPGFGGVQLMGPRVGTAAPKAR